MVAFGRVFEVLNNCKTELSQAEIVKATGISIRSVKYSLKILISFSLAYEALVSNDLRRKMYGGKR